MIPLEPLTPFRIGDANEEEANGGGDVYRVCGLCGDQASYNQEADESGDECSFFVHVFLVFVRSGQCGKRKKEFASFPLLTGDADISAVG